MATRRLVMVLLFRVLWLDSPFFDHALGTSLLPLTSALPMRQTEQLGPTPAPTLSQFTALSPQFTDAFGHHHLGMPSTHQPSFRYGYDCTGFFCSDPLTLAPFGTPCACVLPMKVEMELGVAAVWVFTFVAELAVEIAAGAYVKQSQVRIIAAVSSGNNLERTRVTIDLIPLDEKFDITTALLIYERFWRKEISINATIFGDYEVLVLRYPGLPTSMSSSPRGSESREMPLAAHLPTDKAKNVNPRIIIAVISSSLIFAILCATVACIVFKTRKLRNPSTSHDPICAPSIQRGSGARFTMSSSMESTPSLSLASTMATCHSLLKTFSLTELERATHNFSPHMVLGEGGFGCVYRGTIDGGTEVAVKLLKRKDEKGEREFIAEFDMLRRLHHRNLVKLLGICTEGCTRCLVYELVRNGSLESHLHGVDKKEPLDWDTRVKIALGSAKALSYLHEDSNPCIIHRDFKASNILLDDDFTPRLSDFGLARVAAEGSRHVSTHVMGTFGYVAPEYAMTGHLLVKSDVYSYGVVLLELLSGRKPVDMSRPEGQENLVAWARSLLTSQEGLVQLVDPSLEGKYDFEILAQVASIASMCVQPEVTHRPSMMEVVQALQLVHNDRDEGCNVSYGHRDSHATDCDASNVETPPEGNWWDHPTPLTTVAGCASSFITMEYSSGPLDEMARARLSPSGNNMSGPLRTKHHRRIFARLRGSMSEHGFLSGHFAY